MCICVYGSCHYQADLGLQLNLQGLQGPLEVIDFTAGGLEGLCAGCHLLVQLVKLEENEVKIVTRQLDTSSFKCRYEIISMWFYKVKCGILLLSPWPCTKSPFEGGSSQRCPHTEI